MGNPTFDMKVLGADGLHRIVLSGELDLACCPTLMASVQDLLSTRPRELEIDLRQVRFIDSTGLRTLLVAREESGSLGIPFFVIPSDSPQVRNVFAITSVEDQLPWRAPISSRRRATIEGLEDAYSADSDPEPAA
jgi:anti-anti-sigma factor